MPVTVIKKFNSYAEFYDTDKLVQIKPEFKKPIVDLCKKYNIDNFRLIIKYNNRLRTTMGCMCPKYNDRNVCWIELNPNFVLGCLYDWDNDGAKALLSTIKHETIYFILYHLHKPFNDGTRAFEQMLAENHVASSGYTSDSKRISTTENISYAYNKKTNSLVKYSSEFKKEAKAEAKISDITKAQEQQILEKLQKKVISIVKQDLANAKLSNVEVDINFSDRLKNYLGKYDYYKSTSDKIVMTISKHNLLLLYYKNEFDNKIGKPLQGIVDNYIKLKHTRWHVTIE